MNLGWPKGPGPPKGGDVFPAILITRKESIVRTQRIHRRVRRLRAIRAPLPYYLITLIFHDQAHSIESQVNHLQEHIRQAGFPNGHNIHSAPLIRREKDYRFLDSTARRKLFRSLFNFVRLCDISYSAFVFRKREHMTHDHLVSRMSRDIGLFVRENLAFFQSFDQIIVYYDNGQKEITNIVNSVFSVFLDAEIRKVSPSDYSLFQAADMICTLELISQKLENDGLTCSEENFFRSTRDFKKNYLKPCRSMVFSGF